jgi:hypothetical protein
MASIRKPEEEIAGEAGRAGPEPERKPIWEVVDEIMRGVPAEALSRLPADGAERHDDYLRSTHEKASRES